jgi:uncharacterized protein YggE
MIVALAFLALGCTDETTLVQSDQQPAGISVTGTGTASGEPDIAILTMGVESQQDTVAEARSTAAESMNGVIDAVKEAGVAEEDIQTTRFSVQPVYDFSNNRQTLTGFIVSNIVTAKIRDIDSTGDVIDAAVEAGGNLARVENLSFTIDDPSTLEEQARVDAMAEARSRAETLADAGGVDLGDPISISESGGVVPVDFAGERAAAQAADDFTPILTGELDVSVTVQVVYALGN